MPEINPVKTKSFKPLQSVRSKFVLLAVMLTSVLLMGIGGSGIEGIWPWLPAAACVLIALYSFVVFRFSESDCRAWHAAPATESLFVTLVVPVYNEDPELFARCLKSISSQTRLPEQVWVVDDGSVDEQCTNIALQWAQEQECDDQVNVEVLIFERNQGKRHAITEVFRADEQADVFFTVDSDTVLDARAIEEGVKPFSNPEIFAVAGVLFGHNRNESLFTRVVDLEFSGGFLINRTAMSKWGSVLVTCGSLAAYRADICRDNIDNLLQESFLGSTVINGDDRKLTQFALQRGKVVFQESCIGWVALPQSLGHFIRQRVRWSTSIVRGTISMLKSMPMNRTAFWLTLLHAGEFAAQIVLLLVIGFFGSSIGWSNLILMTVAVLLPDTVLRHQRYWQTGIVSRKGVTWFEYLMLAPLATLLSIVVLIPVRFYSLFFLRSQDWRTRHQVEELTMADDAETD